MRFYLVLLLFGAGTLAALWRFPFAACLFLWNDIFQPLAFARMPTAFQSAWYVLYVLIGSYVISVATGRIRPQLNFNLLYIPFYMAWIAITAAHSTFLHARDGAIEIVKYIAPLMLISSGLNSIRQVKVVTLVLAASVGVWSMQAGVHGLVKGVTKDMGIPGGQMTDNNDFMAATVSILPVLIYLAFTYQGPYRLAAKWAGGLMAALSVSAIVFSNSRGAALGVAALILLYTAFVSRRKIRDGVAFLVIIGVTLLVLPQSFWDRMNTIELSAEQSEGSAAERLYMMKATFQAVLLNPVFGVGPGCWLEAAPLYTGKDLDPHNIWLKLSAEIGIPGLLLYLFIPGYTIYGLMGLRTKAIRRREGDVAALCVTLVMAIVGYLLPSTFLSHPFSEFLWAWYCIGGALVVILKRRYAPAPPPKPVARRFDE
jgi:O-antigen ligase